MTTEERLENLERKLARAKRRNRWLLAAVLLGAGVVILAAAWIGTPEKVLAENAAKAAVVIRANAFVVVDENGKARAELSMMVPRGGATEKFAAAMREKAALFLYDENGKTIAFLGFGLGGSMLELYDEQPKLRAALVTGKDGMALNLVDENGRPRATVGASVVTKPDGTKIISPESTIHLYNKEGKVIWQAP